jgi:hypothetical protein
METLPTFGQKTEMLPEPYLEGYIPLVRETRGGAWMNTESNRWYPSTLEHLLPKTAWKVSEKLRIPLGTLTLVAMEESISGL